MEEVFTFTARVWLYEGFAGWHFVNVPKELSEEIKERYGSEKKRGWGAIAVQANIGTTNWKTSIFPSKTGEYLLALKAEVRKREEISEGDTVSVKLAIL